MIETLIRFVGLMLSLAGASYVASIVLSYLALRNVVEPDDLKYFLFAPAVRLGSALLPMIGLFLMIKCLGSEVPTFVIVMVFLVIPSVFTALLISTCYYMAKMAFKYRSSIWPALPGFLPTLTLSSSLVFLIVKSMAKLIPEAYMGLFLVYTAVFSAYGCMSYQPSFLMSR